MTGGENIKTLESKALEAEKLARELRAEVKI